VYNFAFSHHALPKERNLWHKFWYPDGYQIMNCGAMTDAISLQWNIMCDNNEWKLTLVGTVNNVGQFVGFPLAGLFSDR
jgi:hypothetical protein